MPHHRPFPRICIALGLPDAARLLEHARQEAESGETFLEFRLDHLDQPVNGIKVIREFLKAHSGCIVLATCRRHQNHGKFNGSVEEQLRILEGILICRGNRPVSPSTGRAGRDSFGSLSG